MYTMNEQQDIVHARCKWCEIDILDHYNFFGYCSADCYEEDYGSNDDMYEDEESDPLAYGKD